MRNTKVCKMERVKQTEERSFADMSNEELLAEY